MKPPRDMTDDELQQARERLEEEARSLREAARNVENEIWLRQFNRDVSPKTITENDRGCPQGTLPALPACALDEFRQIVRAWAQGHSDLLEMGGVPETDLLATRTFLWATKTAAETLVPASTGPQAREA